MPFCGLSSGEIIPEVLEMRGTPQKNQSGQLLQSQTNPEIGKQIKNQWKQHIFLFPLIPTRATTTTLAQKLENIQNHPKPMKTMFNQWVAKKAKFWRYYAGFSWSYLIMFKLYPTSAKWETFFGRSCAADHSCLPSARKNMKKLYRYHFANVQVEATCTSRPRQTITHSAGVILK